MSRKSELVKVLKKFSKKLRSHSPSRIREQRFWLFRTFLINQKRNRKKLNRANAGFVLPTVVMVSLVVVLLTTAILFRSFERSKSASNVRVNETTLNAASPAVERARSKISKLFQDPRLPRSTPSNTSLTQVIDSNVNEFTFGDETALKLKITEGPGKLKEDLKITSTLTNEEKEANTAWKYPVDTDNNGKFDSYTLYGIYYRTPANTTTTTFGSTTTTTQRSRIPLEARALPMDEGLSSSQCQTDVTTSANLIDGQGWFKTGGRLKRSIFVYTTTVPITNLTGIATSKQAKYEVFKGNKGFTAIEYQQDRERIPINNNAVLYEDDLEIAPGRALNINGRIFTNGNLLTRQEKVRYYLVSSDKSCYFFEENSKIIVAGNVINTRVNEQSNLDNSNLDKTPRVDLFNKTYDDTKKSNINNTNKTVPTATYGNLAAYNDEAYVRRINRLVEATTALYPNKNQLPTEVTQAIDQDMAADQTLTFEKARDEQLRIYFRRRTRRIPYAEVPFGGNALKSYATTSPLLSSGETLRPIDTWVFPFKPSNGTDAATFAEIAINSSGNKIRLDATDPEVQVEAGKEDKIGDRILVGNNLPQYWFDTAKNKFIKEAGEGQDIVGKQWDNNTKTRKRFSQAYQLDNLGITDRDDFWEKSAAEKPEGNLDIVGGLRVVTGGGIYLPRNITAGSTGNSSTSLSSLPSSPTPTSSPNNTIWSDSMAMGVDVMGVDPATSKAFAPQGLPDIDKTPYLRMRATAVYHYQKDTYNGKNPTDYQTPIACVSSYYDPTNATTARNRTGLPIDAASGGLSHNGVVYPVTAPLTVTPYEAALKYQAQLKHPNGRWVNEQLQKAMSNKASGKLTLAEQSAIDSAVCALKIFDGTIGSASGGVIPHGAIKETSFLDARQVKAIDKTTGSQNYDLDVEQRQPLEIRTTVLDLDLLRTKPISGNYGSDFLIPNSGIIYATREDALADASDTSKDVSATDFKLDPTRRPNGIMLINGSNLSRYSTTYEAKEKGLILASNLPVYIQGQKDTSADEGYFNKHTQEEFTDNSLKNATTTFAANFYARTTLSPNFACRKGQTGCGSDGETWRPASVIADSITVLSHNFKLGFRQDGDYDLRYNYDGNYTVGYDVDGDGIIDPSTSTKTVTLSEVALKVDVDGDGIADKASVNIKESNITATVATRLNGFWDNNFVTSRNFTDTNYSGTRPNPLPANFDSSYFNNFVTPIQRRVNYSEYVMEICRKATVTACTPNDWVVGYDLNEDGDFNDSVTVNGNTYAEKDIKANQLLKAFTDAKVPKSTFAFDITKLSAGTTARAAKDANDQGYPRRVAFLRHRTGQTVANGGIAITGNTNTLVLDSGKPVPLGIIGSGSNLGVSYFPYSNKLTVDGTDYSAYSTSTTDRPRTVANALWFKGIKAASASANYDPQDPLWIENSSSLTGTQQPLLVPVTQLQFPFITGSGGATNKGVTNGGATIEDTGDVAEDGSWIQLAKKTETNLVFAQGNTPGRPSESNGGLENFVRYLENWKDISHIASGAFIQFKRSSFATAPWQAFTATRVDDYITGFGAKTAFGYPQGYRTTVTADKIGNNTSKLGRSPFYNAPTNRLWGYDVALLTQQPDLFSQRFTTPSVAEPNEFFREVGRDDAWVKTLLCAAEDSSNATTGTNAGYESASDVGSGFKYAISKDQRPKACQ
jgi:hypothetical protein